MLRGVFAREVYRRLHIPANEITLVFAVAWAEYENTNARNNPWATTMPYPGCTEFNSVGVKNYRTIDDGIQATVETLKNGDYDTLLLRLRTRGTTPRALMAALNASPWGSRVDEGLFLEVAKNYSMYNVEVPGSVGEYNGQGKEAASKEGGTESSSEEGATAQERKEVMPDYQKLIEAGLTPEQARVLSGVTVGATSAPEPTTAEDTLESRLAAAGLGPSSAPEASAPTPAPVEATTPPAEDTLESRLAALTTVADAPVTETTTVSEDTPPKLNTRNVFDYLSKARLEGAVDDATWSGFFEF